MSHLSEQDAIEELVGLLLVLSDVGIGMHTKDLRMGGDGQGTNIVQVTLMLEGSVCVCVCACICVWCICGECTYVENYWEGECTQRITSLATFEGVESCLVE